MADHTGPLHASAPSPTKKDGFSQPPATVSNINSKIQTINRLSLETEGGFVYPQPVFRCLRGFALDPSLRNHLDTVPVSLMIFKVPWEVLSPGPAGEYLEVIDYDPASKCFYEPINLDDPRLLAQGGYAPSEGVPQFHQQMVYAVSSLTIRHFERALGRKALWRPGPGPDPKKESDDSRYVQKNCGKARMAAEVLSECRSNVTT